MNHNLLLLDYHYTWTYFSVFNYRLTYLRLNEQTNEAAMLHIAGLKGAET